MSDMHKKPDSYVPLDCPYCQYMMRDLNDCLQYQVTQCCVECWIGFLEPLRNIKQDAGYLPSIAEINKYRERISNFETETQDA